MGKQGMIAIRLSEKEIKELDAHTQGQLSRSQIVRLLIEDFLSKSKEEQRDFLFNRLFGE